MPFSTVSSIVRLCLFMLLFTVSASADTVVSGAIDAAATAGDFLVIYVQDNEVYLDVTREKGSSMGRRYTIERLGAEIKHPVTGELMGRARTRIGEVQITWIQEGFCKARVVGTTAEGGIRVKDLARPSESTSPDQNRVVAPDAARPSASAPAAPVTPSTPVTPTATAAPPAPPAGSSRSLEQISYKEGGEISALLNFTPVDMTAADLDGDGVDELIFAEERHIRIMRIKVGGTLEEIARVSVGWAARVVHVTAGDIDRDGKAEIYVVEKPGNYVRATGYRFVNNRLEKFWKENDMFLRVSRTAEGDVLYGQRYGSGRPFERGILRYRLAGGAMQSASAGLPGSFTIYDFAVVGSSGYYGSIDHENKLRLFNSAGEVQWTSAESYGGSDVKIMSADGRNSMEERGGIASVDVNADQVDDLLVVQNMLDGGLGSGFIRLGALQQYKSGRLIALGLEGGQLVERWKTKTYTGIIKGFTLARPLGRGREAVFFTLEKAAMRDSRATLRIVPVS